MCSQLHAERTNKQQRLHLLEASDKDPDAEDGPATVVVCITKREKAESGAQRGKPKGTLESESRNAIS